MAKQTVAQTSVNGQPFSFSCRINSVDPMATIIATRLLASVRKYLILGWSVNEVDFCVWQFNVDGAEPVQSDNKIIPGHVIVHCRHNDIK